MRWARQPWKRATARTVRLIKRALGAAFTRLTLHGMHPTAYTCAYSSQITTQLMLGTGFLLVSSRHGHPAMTRDDDDDDGRTLELTGLRFTPAPRTMSDGEARTHAARTQHTCTAALPSQTRMCQPSRGQARKKLKLTFSWLVGWLAGRAGWNG